jgi:hypothetical protein
VIENRARQHQAIRECDRNADRKAAAQAAKQPAGRRTVKKDGIADAREHRGDYKRLALLRKSYVAYKCFIEDFVYGVTIVHGAMGLTDKARSLCYWKRIGHGKPRSRNAAQS